MSLTPDNSRSGSCRMSTRVIGLEGIRNQTQEEVPVRAILQHSQDILGEVKRSSGRASTWMGGPS